MFTEEQQTTIRNAARPLSGYDRAAFTGAVYAFFNGRTEVGDGELSRAVRELLQEHRRSTGRANYPTHLR